MLPIYYFLAHSAQRSDGSGDHRRKSSSTSQKSHHSKLTRRSQTVSVPEKIDLQDRKNNGYNGLSFNDLQVSNLDLEPCSENNPKIVHFLAWRKSYHWGFHFMRYKSFVSILWNIQFAQIHGCWMNCCKFFYIEFYSSLDSKGLPIWTSRYQKSFS